MGDFKIARLFRNNQVRLMKNCKLLKGSFRFIGVGMSCYCLKACLRTRYTIFLELPNVYILNYLLVLTV